jgi:hydroxymethylpyrimidine pyrophosphatase-like HAD family hydrolase
MIIAIDFDGTIVEDQYPKIGKPLTFAFETLKQLEKDGHRLILWTYRSGQKLDEAVEFCGDNGIEFYAINESYEGEILHNNTSRKINADIFIDDRNIGGMMNWGEIYQKISNNSIEEIEKKLKTKKKKGFFSYFRK